MGEDGVGVETMARFSWGKKHQGQVSINFFKLNDTNSLATS